MDEIDIPIKILHLEDDESDSQFAQIWLKKEGIVYDYFFADNEKTYREILSTQNIDIILLTTTCLVTADLMPCYWPKPNIHISPLFLLVEPWAKKWLLNRF